MQLFNYFIRLTAGAIVEYYILTELRTYKYKSETRKLYTHTNWHVLASCGEQDAGVTTVAAAQNTHNYLFFCFLTNLKLSAVRSFQISLCLTNPAQRWHIQYL